VKKIDGCTSSSVNPPPTTEPDFALPYLQDPAAGIYQKLHNSLLRRIQKMQLDAQLILNTFRRPIHVSGVSKPIIRRYNCSSNPTRKADIHLKRIVSNNCCIHTVVHPDDGPTYARNM